MKAITAPRITSHNVVNTIVLICGFSWFTFAMFTVRSISLVLSLVSTPFADCPPGPNGGRCLSPWPVRRAGH
jgi:hypothetical protein